MPKRIRLEIDEKPFHYEGKYLRMTKSYTNQDFLKHTVLTDDLYTFVSFYFSIHKKTMKYNNLTLKAKYGDPQQYHYEFYWNQSKSFYYAAKSLPLESAPLAAYYCILNAAKCYIAFKSALVDDFVEDFGSHGLNEDHSDSGEDLSTIRVKRKQKGVFPIFSKMLDSNFDTLWSLGSTHTLKGLLYNLPFVHRAYSMTYSTRSKKIDELFIPLNSGSSPRYHKANDSNLYLIAELEKSFFATSSHMLPTSIASTLPDNLKIVDGKGFTLRSDIGAKRNSNSISQETKELNKNLRKSFTYIRSHHRLWYVKRTKFVNSEVINLCSMTIIMAAMHRISEIVRYKPEQLNRIMKSKENWLVHEFVTLALDQFIDEIASEITGQEIMCTAQKE